MVGLFVTALVGLYTIEDLWNKFGDRRMPVVCQVTCSLSFANDEFHSELNSDTGAHVSLVLSCSLSLCTWLVSKFIFSFSTILDLEMLK